MGKIPCIKCDPKLWKYVKPYLERWGYDVTVIGNWNVYQLLVINYCGFVGCCNNVTMEGRTIYNRELVDDVEEFLEKATKLKGFIYNKSIENKFILHNIELKPGMGLYINSYGASDLYIIFPIKDSLAVIPYGKSFKWQTLDNFISTYKESIVAISDINNDSILGENVIWRKSNSIITKQEIAKKFGCDVSQIEIV